MAWAIFVLVVVLIVIALMRFNLTALSEPCRFETRTANMAKRFFHSPRKRWLRSALWALRQAAVLIRRFNLLPV